MKYNYLSIILLFVFLILSRLITDIPNFTPTIALVVFAGYFIPNKYLSILVVLLSQLASDIYLGLYGSMIFVYLAYVSIVLVSPIIIKKMSMKSVLSASIVAPILFFIISKFGVWITSANYSSDLSGVLACYIAGIPFFDESLVSSILFSLTIFAIYKIALTNSKNVSAIK